jgi:hypothetical protein
MRSSVRRTLILAHCFGVAVIAAGCEGKKVTEYVPGISTQVIVPRDLKSVRVEVSVGGISQFCKGYRVYDGKVLLPRSIGNFAQSASTISNGPVTYTITGLTTNDVDSDFFANCLQSKISATDNVRVLRKSRQPFIENETLFLPMPLKYGCYDKQCDDKDGEEMTCKGGTCVKATLTDAEIKQLKPYTPDLLDGTGATCFHAQQWADELKNPHAGCMTTATPAITVDAATCTYAVAASASAPAPLPFPGAPPPTSAADAALNQGVNVEILYDGGLVREILDLDPDEGFFIPDASSDVTRQRFRLSPGLCGMVKGIDADGKPTPHRITAIRASGICRAKLPDQPLCANDQLAAMGVNPDGVTTNPPPTPACSTTELIPPPSALIVVVDNTPNHQPFFAALKNTSPDPANEDSLVRPAINGALSDPAFDHTDIGLVYAPGDNQCKAGAPEKIPGPARTVRDPILTDLANKPAQGTTPELGAALQRAYTELEKATYANYYRRAVLVLGNSGFSETECGVTAIKVAGDALKGDAKISTYVMQLTKAPERPTTGPWAADDLANAGGTGKAAYKATEGTAKFQEIVDSLATCVYETPDTPTAPKAGDIVSFASPLTSQTTTLNFNAACTGDGAGSGQGWGLTSAQGKKRIFLCPQSCADYQGILAQTTKFSAIYQQPPIPVPVFAYSTACQQ